MLTESGIEGESFVSASSVTFLCLKSHTTQIKLCFVVIIVALCQLSSSLSFFKKLIYLFLRCSVVLVEGDPHPGALKGRMSFQSFNPSIDVSIVYVFSALKFI